MIDLIDPIDDADLDYLERTLRRPGSTHRQPKGTMLSAVIRLRRDEILVDQLGDALQNLLGLLYDGRPVGATDEVDAIVTAAEAVLATLGDWNKPGVPASAVAAIAEIDEQRRKQLGMGLVKIK